jgi:hypothetical protein
MGYPSPFATGFSVQVPVTERQILQKATKGTEQFPGGLETEFFAIFAFFALRLRPFDKPLDMLGALSLSKRLRVPSGVEGLRALSLPAVSQTLSEVEWELVEPVETGACRTRRNGEWIPPTAEFSFRFPASAGNLRPREF